MMEAVHATEEWQRAGVHYIRIQAMCVGFDIPLKYEFADDTKDSEYILVHENGFPVSTCRVRIDEENAGHIERVATLEEYRGKHYGALGIKAAEQLLKERGVFAEIVTGQAYIENGNISKASANARKNAMRSYVEEKLGVQVKSTTEVVNNMLVRDSIVARANGYLLVKKVVSERILGEIYQVTLELEASNDLINSMTKDVAAQLLAIDEDSSRNGVHVAIVDEDIKNTVLWNSYFTGMLKQAGFRAEINDDVVLYLSQNINNFNDLKMNTEIRRIGRTGDRGTANAVIRGRVGLARKTEKIAERSYKAVAQVNCELIGYDNNSIDVAAGYYYYVADNAELAEQMAKEVALRTILARYNCQLPLRSLA